MARGWAGFARVWRAHTVGGREMTRTRWRPLDAPRGEPGTLRPEPEAGLGLAPLPPRHKRCKRSHIGLRQRTACTPPWHSRGPGRPLRREEVVAARCLARDWPSCLLSLRCKSFGGLAAWRCANGRRRLACVGRLARRPRAARLVVFVSPIVSPTSPKEFFPKVQHPTSNIQHPTARGNPRLPGSRQRPPARNGGSLYADGIQQPCE